MAKKNRKGKIVPSSGHAQRLGPSAPAPALRESAELHPRPLKVARVLSCALLMIGIVMLILGCGVLTGTITEGWGFPMSSVSNWGRPWGAILMAGAIAYISAPVILLVRPRKGTLLIMAVSGLSVLVGTPLITTATEILYNMLAQHDCQSDWTICHPTWIDSVWGYFMLLHVGILVATYRSLDPAPVSKDTSAPQSI